MTDPDQTLLIQFAKWPQAGRVKTRLAVALGDDGALQAHLRLSLAVLARLQATGLPLAFWWDRPLSPPPAEAEPLLAALTAAAIPQGTQQGADLGERMSRALTEGLTRYRQVIIVGSDCPSVEPGYIAQAQQALEDHDLVMGPSEDGGYVMIGARTTVPGMLDNIAWGTPGVLAQTRERLTALQLSFTLLEPRWDVDEPEDWERFLAAQSERVKGASEER